MLPDEIQTARLRLRPFVLTDASAVHAYSNHPDWLRFQPVEIPYTPREAEKTLAEFILRDREKAPVWAVERDGEVIGIASLVFEAEHRIAQLGYGIHQLHRGQGLALEATRGVLGPAFRHCEPLRRVRARTDAHNVASHRVLEKLGFAREATLRQNVYFRGQFVDEAIYGLLREEWDA